MTNITFKQWEDLASKGCPPTFTGALVKQAREMAGWTQEQLGERLGVTRQCVAGWERKGVDKVKACAIRFAVIYHDII